MPSRQFRWIRAGLGILLLTAATLRSSPTPADKPETWVEIASPHFTVMSNDGERTARRIAQQFEQIRILYSKALSPNLRLDPGIPIEIIAARNEKSLSQIIPEYWAQKGHTHPAGLFLPGPERNYIALRTDVEGEFPYLTVYHEYVHLIINLNFQHLPLWLNEGYATFFGSATLSFKSGRLGQPNESELYVLQQTKLLPLDVLFRVGNDSPYYNEAEKSNVFYAESWALIHYLMTEASREKGKQLGKYITLTENGGDPVESAEMAFGDLGRLKKELDSYVSRTSYTEYVVELPDAGDSKAFSFRAVPTAEAEATLGEFDVGRRQLDAAQTKIEDAIRLDPNLALAQEAMGFLLFRQDRRPEAQKYFSRAVALDSKSALAYYYDGMLLVSSDAGPENADEAQAALEKAVALKPELAPAWDSLARIYVSNPDARDKALKAAENAVKAMPGEPAYRLNLASVLVRMGKFDDARAIVQGVIKSGKGPLAAQAEQFLTQIDRQQEYSSSRNDAAGGVSRPEIDRGTQSTETVETKRPDPVMKRRTLESTDSAATAPPEAGKSTAASAAAAGPVNSTHAYSMTGMIGAVNCANAPQMELTLQSVGIVMKLHAADFAKIDIKAEPGHGASAKPSCPQFAGKKARFSYQLVSQKSWDGEIVSVEFQSAP